MSQRARIPLLALSVSLIALAVTAADPATHRQTVERWRQERDESLRDAEGWLSLVGLYWLRPGENSFGSGPDADLEFPPPAPARLGVFHLDNGAVSVEPAAGVTLRSEGSPLGGRTALVADDQPEPTTLAWGSLRFFAIRRGAQVGIRLKDRRSHLLETFSGMESYPIDAGWRLDAVFVPHDPPKVVDVPSVLGTVDATESPGSVRFARDGESFGLDALAASGGRLFLIFADTTNGDETYGGGRFLYAGPPAADGSVELDFNLAYNPPCVFTPFATCPLPPRQNRLPIPVRAGELVFQGGAGH